MVCSPVSIYINTLTKEPTIHELLTLYQNFASSLG